MELIKKLFGGIEFTWKKTMLFAVIIAIYTGLINQVPFLLNTSFRDIAITLEMWIFFAMIIMMNSKTPLESALKTFVFFLISQPLIYLVEVPFLGWQVMSYYKNWIFLTILTFPMAYIGHYIKKGNMLGLLILSPAIVFLIWSGFSFLGQAFYSFPHHLLSGIFCLILPVIFILALFNNKKEKIAGFILIVAMMIASFVIAFYIDPYVYDINALKLSSDELFFDSSYKVYLEDNTLGDVSIGSIAIGDENESAIKATFRKAGKTKLIIEAPSGERAIFDLLVGIRTVDLDLIESNLPKNETRENTELLNYNISHDEK